MTLKWTLTRDCDSGWFCASLTPSWVVISTLPSLLQSSWIHFLSRRGWWRLQPFWEPPVTPRQAIEWIKIWWLASSHGPDPPGPFRTQRLPPSRFRLPHLCQQPNRRSLRRPDWETGSLAGRHAQYNRSASARKPMNKTAYSAVHQAKQAPRSAGCTLTVTKLSVEQTLPGSCV